jgi:hypothetical protein
MKIFEKFKQNLKYDDGYIYSYDTKVGKIKNGWLIIDKYYSVTTSKHLNYAAKILKLNVLKNY